MKLMSPEALPPPSSPPHPVAGSKTAAKSAASVQALPRTGGNLIRSLFALGLLVLAGCAGSDDDGESASRQLPACAKPAKTIPKPKALPPSLPIPPGSLFTTIEQPFPGQSIATGVSPGSLESTRSFYETALGDAGYQQGRGESEPGETEALFTGGGVRGGWRANAIPECDGAVRLTLVVVKS
jgi:hypothetical protein